MASVPKRHKPKSVNLAKGAKARPGSMRSDGSDGSWVVSMGRWGRFYLLASSAETRPLVFSKQKNKLVYYVCVCLCILILYINIHSNTKTKKYLFARL